MKKALLTTAIAATAAVAFAQGNASSTPYDVTATAPDGIKKVYIIDVAKRAAVIDSATVSGGKFTLKGRSKKGEILGLTVDGRSYSAFFNDGTPVTIDLSTHKLKGSALNERLNGYDRKIDSLSNEIGKQAAKYSEAVAAGKSEAELETLMKELRSKYVDPLSEQMTAVAKQAVTENLDNDIPAVFIGTIAYDLPYAELKQLLDPKYAYTKSPLAQQAKSHLASIEAKEAMKGKQFFEITLNDTEGKPHKLSEYCGKGNYVMLDFWASWCGPCRMEMPNVKAAYEKYHPKGFQIVGLSLDRNAEAWKKGIADLGITWTNLSDLKFWQSEVARLYGIKSIPASILVDPQGKIVDYDLRAEKLGQKLKDIYGF